MPPESKDSCQQGSSPGCSHECKDSCQQGSSPGCSHECKDSCQQGSSPGCSQNEVSQEVQLPVNGNQLLHKDHINGATTNLKPYMENIVILTVSNPSTFTTVSNSSTSTTVSNHSPDVSQNSTNHQTSTKCMPQAQNYSSLQTNSMLKFYLTNPSPPITKNIKPPSYYQSQHMANSGCLIQCQSSKMDQQQKVLKKRNLPISNLNSSADNPSGINGVQTSKPCQSDMSTSHSLLKQILQKAKPPRVHDTLPKTSPNMSYIPSSMARKTAIQSPQPEAYKSLQLHSVEEKHMISNRKPMNQGALSPVVFLNSEPSRGKVSTSENAIPIQSQYQSYNFPIQGYPSIAQTSPQSVNKEKSTQPHIPNYSQETPCENLLLTQFKQSARHQNQFPTHFIQSPQHEQENQLSVRMQPPRHQDHFPTQLKQPTQYHEHFPTQLKQPSRYQEHFPTQLKQPPRYQNQFPTQVMQPPQYQNQFPPQVMQPPQYQNQFPPQVMQPPQYQNQFPPQVMQPPQYQNQFPPQVMQPPQYQNQFPPQVMQPPQYQNQFPPEVIQPPYQSQSSPQLTQCPSPFPSQLMSFSQHQNQFPSQLMPPPQYQNQLPAQFVQPPHYQSQFPTQSLLQPLLIAPPFETSASTFCTPGSNRISVPMPQFLVSFPNATYMTSHLKTQKRKKTSRVRRARTKKPKVTKLGPSSIEENSITASDSLQILKPVVMPPDNSSTSTTFESSMNRKSVMSDNCSTPSSPLQDCKACSPSTNETHSQLSNPAVPSMTTQQYSNLGCIGIVVPMSKLQETSQQSSITSPSTSETSPSVVPDMTLCPKFETTDYTKVFLNLDSNQYHSLMGNRSLSSLVVSNDSREAVRKPSASSTFTLPQISAALSNSLSLGLNYESNQSPPYQHNSNHNQCQNDILPDVSANHCHEDNDGESLQNVYATFENQLADDIAKQLAALLDPRYECTREFLECLDKR